MARQRKVHQTPEKQNQSALQLHAPDVSEAQGWYVIEDRTFWEERIRNFMERYERERSQDGEAKKRPETAEDLSERLTEHARLDAERWDGEEWFFTGGSLESEQIFKGLAAQAVSGLGNLSQGEPWEAWLECLINYAGGIKGNQARWVLRVEQLVTIQLVFYLSAEFCRFLRDMAPLAKSDAEQPRPDSSAVADTPREPAAEEPSAGNQRHSETETQISKSLKKKRQEIVHKYAGDHDLIMAGLANHVAISLSAIHGIIREDRSRYSEETRNRFLKKIGISLKRWYQE